MPDVTEKAQPTRLWPAFVRSFPHAYEERRGRQGVHALVIGVSSYPNLKDNPFKLAQLSCAAASAAEFANWLLGAYTRSGDMPLTSVRLLLSPSKAELARLQKLDAAGVARAEREPVRKALNAWADDCNSCAGNFAMLYAVGHGVAATDAGPHLLLEDFWDTQDLDASLYVPSIQSSLGTYSNVRRSALFIDCCQQIRPRPEWELGRGISLSRNKSKKESRTGAGTYFAAPRGGSALGVAGERTLFLATLLDCLRGQASVKREDSDGWYVASESLGPALKQLISSKQPVWPRVEGDSFEICPVHDPPKSSVTVHVQPAGSHSAAMGSTEEEITGNKKPFTMSKNPEKIPLDCGSYTVRLQVSPWDVQPRFRNVFVLPPKGAKAEFKVLKLCTRVTLRAAPTSEYGQHRIRQLPLKCFA